MTNHVERVLDALPTFPDDRKEPWRKLEVFGSVGRTLTLSLEDLEALPSGETLEDFRCEEGWVVPQQRWEGPSVWSLLEKAGVSPEARFATFIAGDFSITLKVQDVLNPSTRLALRLNGEAIPAVHGGPCRLVVPEKYCYHSVKWVERIVVSVDRPQETAPAIALERIGRPSS